MLVLVCVCMCVFVCVPLRLDGCAGGVIVCVRLFACLLG